MENFDKLNEVVKALNDDVAKIPTAHLGDLNGIQHHVRHALNAMLVLETKVFQDIDRLVTRRRAALQQEAVDAQRKSIKVVYPEGKPVEKPVEKIEVVAVEEKLVKKVKKAKKSK